MADDQSILKLERLRDDLGNLKSEIRKRYGAKSQVTASEVKRQSARLAEGWLADFMGRRDLVSLIDQDYVADVSVPFNRLLTFSEQAAQRSSYEQEINAILKDFTGKIVIPLKRHLTLEQSGGSSPSVAASQPAGQFVATSFIGHSFAPADENVVEVIITTLNAIGLAVVTGRKPRAERISDKVK